MQIYTVGGYVRDLLLRREGVAVPPVGDRDWVVVGASPEEMIAKGFLPVGADFPVFLHPVTHEEYALARTERKTAPGYHGFVFHAAPSVTLEDDLFRRDLTVNAIAMDGSGKLIDPCGGIADLHARILRHVSNAFTEDPVRILRTARFAARFPDFSIAPETLALMKDMVSSGEVDALVPERVWAETIRAMAAPAPLRFVDTLLTCGAWSRLFKTLPAPSPALRAAINRSVRDGLSAENRFLLLLTAAPTPTCAAQTATSLRTPAAIQQTAQTLCTALPLFAKAVTAEDTAQLFERTDALRRPERTDELITIWETLSNKKAPHLRAALKLWKAVDAGAVAHQQSNPRTIPAAVRAARVDAISTLFYSKKPSDDHDNGSEKNCAH